MPHLPGLLVIQELSVQVLNRTLSIAGRYSLQAGNRGFNKTRALECENPISREPSL